MTFELSPHNNNELTTIIPEKLLVPVREEQLLAARLRAIAMVKIESEGEENAAQKLDLAIPGLKALLWQNEWSCEQAIRVAVALEIIDEAAIERIATKLLRGDRVAVPILPPPGDDYDKDVWDHLHEAREEIKQLHKAIRWLWLNSPSDSPPPSWVQEACASALSDEA